MKHSIRFDNDALSFSASHFITFGNPEQVEALHGHNFRIMAEIAGPMNSQSYVVDFVAAFDELKRICDTLTHHVLLPKEHPFIKIKTIDPNVQVTMPPLTWTFPKDDTLLLPLRNTTTEALAEYIAKVLRQSLEKIKAFEYPSQQYVITIELEETRGMWAVYRD